MFPAPEHITEEGDLFIVPEGMTPDEHSAHCRSCQGLIVWVVTRNEKRMPLNADGKSHFATCPHANSWRRRS